MSVWMNYLAIWLLDYYLAATVLLALAWLGMCFERRLVHRMHFAWATSIALLSLLLMTVLPGLPRLGLGLLKVENLSTKTTSEIDSQSNLACNTLTMPVAKLPLASNRLPQQDKSSALSQPSSVIPLAMLITALGVDGDYSLSTLSSGLVVFLTGSAAILCWLGCGALLAWRWRRQCSPISSQWQAELAAIVPEERNTPELLASRSLAQAVVLGFYRPAIVLPEQFLEQENRIAVRQALQHEWAHIAHGDHVMLGLLRVMLPVLYLHPMFWWLRRAVSTNQELLADRAVANHSTPTSYADNLIRWMRNYGNRPGSRLVATLGLWQRPQLLSKRISALLDGPLSVESPLSRSWKWQTFLMTVLVTLAASALSVRPTSQYAQATSASMRDVTDFSSVASESSRSGDELSAIAGTVVDDSGRLLAGVLVDACTWCTGNETHTDKNGFFKLTGFEAGERIQVRFSKNGYSPQMFFDMNTGSENFEVTLNQSTYVEGRVLDSTGVGVADAIVRANQGPKVIGSMVLQDIWSETKTDDQGRYRLYLQPDRYEIEALSPGAGVAKVESLLIASGEARQLDLKLTRGATFHATVVDASTGEPAQGVRLWAWKRPILDAISDESGIVHIDDIPPGKYRLHFDSDRYARWWFATDDSEDERAKRTGPDGWRREFDPRYVEIVNGMLPLKIFVEPGVRLTGLVVDPKSLPVAGATVAPVRTGTGNSITGDTRYSVETDADGAFEMLLPASGEAEYSLIAHDGQYREWRTWANGVSAPLRTQAGDEISEIVLQLTRPGVVHGRVTDDEGAPVADQEVYIRRADGRGHRYYEPETKTTDDGSFALNHVTPGEHLVQLSPLLNTDSSTARHESARVTVRAGEVLRDVTIVAQQ